MMDLLQRLYAYIINHFLPKDDFNPDNVTCSIDDVVVDCNTWEETNYGK